MYVSVYKKKINNKKLMNLPSCAIVWLHVAVVYYTMIARTIFLIFLIMHVMNYDLPAKSIID